jgi:uncharacterized protein (DUF427 family)
VRIEFAGAILVDTSEALRVLETASPPTIYVPRSAVADGVLSTTDHATYCEWKGRAGYFDLTVGDRTSSRAAWGYPEPNESFSMLRDYVAFYPGRVDAAFLDDEKVRPQAGGFYGGWITDDIVGPFKGEAGTLGW